MELNLEYVHDRDFAEGRIGYSRYGIALAKELAKRGVTVYDDLPHPKDVPRRGGQIHHPDENRVTGRSNMVCWVSTPSHAHGWWKDQVPVVSTMWEFSQLPEQFRENLREFATVVVPSRQNQELFGLYHNDVRYIPLGIDPKRWHYVPRQAPEREFRFLIGGSGPRKGVHEAVKAFKKVFDRPPSGPIPKLIMKSPRGFDVHHERIDVVSGHLTDDEEVELYEQAHCYLQPSYGEGFGLQPLQAMAQGIPTILTDAHGHESFAHLGYPLSTKMVPTGRDASLFGDAGEWWEPSLEDLCEWMRYVYENWEKAFSDAKESAELVAERFTWEHTAHRFIQQFGKLMTPYQGADEWHQPHNNVYLTIVTQPWAADIGSKSYRWAPGQRYWETADVKRVLWEAGVLHPDCTLGDGVRAGSVVDTGLTTRQLEDLDSHSGSHSYCPSCHQRLNSRPTKAEDVMANPNGDWTKKGGW